MKLESSSQNTMSLEHYIDGKGSNYKAKLEFQTFDVKDIRSYLFEPTNGFKTVDVHINDEEIKEQKKWLNLTNINGIYECKAFSFEKSDLSWEFEQCNNYASILLGQCGGNLSLVEENSSKNRGFQVTSYITLNRTESSTGIIKCSLFNATSDVRIFAPPVGFDLFLIQNISYNEEKHVLKREIEIGLAEEILLLCQRPLSIYFPEVKWYFNNKKLTTAFFSLSPLTANGDDYFSFIKYFSPNLEGNYSCEVLRKTGEIESKQVTVRYRKMMMMIPQIILKDLTNGHTTVGQNISLECSITFSRIFQLKWNHKYVDNDNKRKSEKEEEDFWNDVVVDTREEIKNVNDTNIYITTSHLKISQASFNHSGYYECGIGNSIVQHGNKIMWVPVHGTNESVLIVDALHFNLMNGQIKFIFLAHPKPTIQWYYNENHIISSLNSSNFIINTSSKENVKKRNYEATLTFRTIDFEHFGKYTVVVKNLFAEISHSVYVNLTGPPKVEMFIENLNEYNVTIKCVAVAHPEPKIQWYFKKCTDLKSCLNFTDVDYIEIKGIEYENYNLTSTSYITISLHEIRILRCRGSNNFGTGYRDEPIFNRHEIYVKNKDIYFQNEEKTVELVDHYSHYDLICGVSNFIYTGEIAWVATKKDKYFYGVYDEFDKEKFLLLTISFWTIMTEPGEEQYATCNVLHRNGFLKSETISFKSQESNYVLIEENNLENSTHEISLGSKWTFYCYFRGFPRTSIRWHKDQRSLKSSDRIKFRNESQVIEFAYLIENDTGNYSCEVYNTYGAKRATGKLITYVNFTWLYVQISGILFVFIFITFLTCLIRHDELNLRQKLKELGLDYNYRDKQHKENLASELNIEEQVDFLNYDKKWEVPFENIKLGKKLGTGAFGVVYKAKVIKKILDDGNAIVAVKTSNLNSGFEGARALASELKILGYVGRHVNIVNLLGACTRSVLKNELYVIVEYCAYGNLRDHVQLYSEHFIDQKNSETDEFDWTIGTDQELEYVKMERDYVNYVKVKEDSSDHELKFGISSKDFLVWSLQISQGMEYLGSRKVVHRDLAARNVLLANNNIVKICDFGLSRKTYHYDIYSKKLQDRLPFRWMAIESIRNGVFSTKSDVWSFGVLLWELFSLGATPYLGIDVDRSFCKSLENGYRMEAPQPTTKRIYQIMLDCWNSIPSMRPSFTDLSHRIGQFLDESVINYIDTNNDYIPMNQEKVDPAQNYLSMAGSSSTEKTGADCSKEKEDVDI